MRESTPHEPEARRLHALEDLLCRPLPVPPEFERMLGYEGDRRHVAFYWTPAGDELCYEDGRSAGTGQWAPWLAWSRHLAVAPCLYGLQLGGSDEEARDWLLLDTAARRLYAGAARDVARFLAGAPDLRAERTAFAALPAEEQARLQRDAAEALRQALLDPSTWAEARGVAGDALARRVDAAMAAEAHHLEALARFLDGLRLPCPHCHAEHRAGDFGGTALGGDATCPSCGGWFWTPLARAHGAP